MNFDDENFFNFVVWLPTQRLPIHITEAELKQRLGDTASDAFFSNFPKVNLYLRATVGLWMEGVLCPENPPHPACKYITVYHEGQQSLLHDVEIPEFGPYWIPDELRS